MARPRASGDGRGKCWRSSPTSARWHVPEPQAMGVVGAGQSFPPPPRPSYLRDVPPVNVMNDATSLLRQKRQRLVHCQRNITSSRVPTRTRPFPVLRTPHQPTSNWIGVNVLDHGNQCRLIANTPIVTASRLPETAALAISLPDRNPLDPRWGVSLQPGNGATSRLFLDRADEPSDFDARLSGGHEDMDVLRHEYVRPQVNGSVWTGILNRFDQPTADTVAFQEPVRMVA